MPSRNREVSSARDYHDRTAHSPRSVRTSGHSLDWNIKPLPFKIYPDLPAVALPRDFPAASADTLAALSAALVPSRPLDLEGLAALLFFSAGVTSNAGLKTGDAVGAVWRPATPRTSFASRSSMTIAAPETTVGSIVEKGAAT